MPDVFAGRFDVILQTVLTPVPVPAAVLRSCRLVETLNPGLTVTWVDRGAETNALFGYMAHGSMIGRRPRYPIPRRVTPGW